MKEYKLYYNPGTKEFASVLVNTYAHRHVTENPAWKLLVTKKLKHRSIAQRIETVRVYDETRSAFLTVRLDAQGIEEAEYPKIGWEVVENKPKHVLMKDNSGMWHLCLVNKWVDDVPEAFIHVFSERGLRITPNPPNNRRDWMDLRNANQSTVKLEQVANLTKFNAQIGHGAPRSVRGFRDNLVCVDSGDFYMNWKLVAP